MAVGNHCYRLLQGRPSWSLRPSWDGMRGVSSPARPIYLTYLVLYEALQMLRAIPGELLKLAVGLADVALQMLGFIASKTVPACVQHICNKSVGGLSYGWEALLGRPLLLSSAWKLLGISVGEGLFQGVVPEQRERDAAIEMLSNALQVSIDAKATPLNDSHWQGVPECLLQSEVVNEVQVLPTGTILVPKSGWEGVAEAPINEKIAACQALSAYRLSGALSYYSINYVSRVFVFLLGWSMLWLARLHHHLSTDAHQPSMWSKLALCLHKLTVWIRGQEASFMADLLSLRALYKEIDAGRAEGAVTMLINCRSPGTSEASPVWEPFMATPSAASRLQALFPNRQTG